MRTAIMALAFPLVVSCSELPDRWELDLIESSRAGAGCSAGPALTIRLTIDDPLSKPIVVGDAGWNCTVESGRAVCTRPLGVDVGTITMTAHENAATLDMAGSCLYVFGPRVHGRS